MLLTLNFNINTASDITFIRQQLEDCYQLAIAGSAMSNTDEKFSIGEFKLQTKTDINIPGNRQLQSINLLYVMIEQLRQVDMSKAEQEAITGKEDKPS